MYPRVTHFLGGVRPKAEDSHPDCLRNARTEGPAITGHSAAPRGPPRSAAGHCGASRLSPNNCTNSKRHDFDWSDPKFNINLIPYEMVLIPNQIMYYDIHISA